MANPAIRSVRKCEDEAQSNLLEQLYVHGVYEKIAIDFEHAQYRPCPDVTNFLMELERGSLVADIGCGNGRYLNVNPNISVVGIDRSRSLLNSARTRASGVTCRADCLTLPYRDGLFDAVLCIGVIHHLVTTPRQAKAMKEICRILRPGGTVLLYAWAWEQEKRKFHGQNVLVPRQMAADCDFLSSDVCSCWAKVSAAEPNLTFTNKLRQFSKSVMSRLWDKQNSLDSCGNSSSTDSLQSSDNDEVSVSEGSADDIIEIPQEFKVREFPASSLFSSSVSSNEKEVQVHKRQCAVHSVHSTQSRHDRFYHVFRKGEIEKLINTNVRNLQIIKCLYKSGHWRATIRKSL